MKLGVCVLLLLLTSTLHSVVCHLPDFTPQLQVEPTLRSNAAPAVMKTTKPGLQRLPGLCRRLKRRRVTVLCHLEKFCWRGQSQKVEAGQVCRCPLGSKCSHFFVHSL